MAHSTSLTAADVVPDLSVHGGPVDRRPQQLHCALITLVAHTIMKLRQDISQSELGRTSCSGIPRRCRPDVTVLDDWA